MLAAAAGRTNAELKLLLGGHAPKPGLPTVVEGVAAVSEECELAVRRVEPPEGQENSTFLEPHAPPSDARAALARPVRGAGRRRANPRTIPAHVRRAVAERDGGRCTWVGDNGKRCDEHSRLEFDHVVPVARVSESTVDGVWLRCRAHNQFETERVFGKGFMAGKREQARQRKEQAEAEAEAAAAAAKKAAEEAAAEEVDPYLQTLGLKAGEARRAAASCAHVTDASAEARLRVLLPTLAPRSGRKFSPATGTWQPLQT